MAEQSERRAYQTADRSAAHYYLERAGILFPLDQRMIKQAAYMDLTLATVAPPPIALVDIDRALESDPCGDDLLAAKVLFLIKLGAMDAAEVTKAKLTACDPLYTPIWPTH